MMLSQDPYPTRASSTPSLMLFPTLAETLAEILSQRLSSPQVQTRITSRSRMVSQTPMLSWMLAQTRAETLWGHTSCCPLLPRTHFLALDTQNGLKNDE